MKAGKNNLVEINILSDEQLAVMAQEGSRTAEELLIKKYRGIVENKASTYFIAGGDVQDIVQEGMIGIYKAVRSYNPEKEASFRTYALICITRQILTAVRNASRLKHMPLNESVSLDNYDSENNEAGVAYDSSYMNRISIPEEALAVDEVITALNRDKSGKNCLLSSLEWKVLQEKIAGKDRDEIAKVLDKTPKSVDNAMQRIRKKLTSYFSDY